LHVLLESGWLIQTQLVDCDLLLLALNVVVFLVLGSTRQTLPWKRSTQEVEQNVSNSLQVVSSRLLITNVCVERSVTGRTSQILTLTEGNVFVLAVLVALSQTEINDINVVLCAFGSAYQEVVRFDIPMDNPFFMHFLNALNHLMSDMKHRL